MPALRPPPRPRVAPLVAVAVLVIVAAACGHHGDGLTKGHIDLGVTTTVGATPCAQVNAAEVTITQASLTATRADAAAKAAVHQQLDALAAGVPASLRAAVATLRSAFDRLWSGGDSGGTVDPFETTAYANADQAVRRYVQSGCTTPSS